MATKKALRPYVTQFDDLYRKIVEVARSGNGTVSVTTDHAEESARVKRIAAYALALAAGIDLTDSDGALPPAFPAGLVKAARRYVYRVEPSRRPSIRLRIAPPLRRASGDLKITFVVASKLSLAGVLTAPLFIAWVALGCVVWGFATFWTTVGQLASYSAAYPFQHPYQTHVVGVGTFIIIPVIWFSRFLDWMDREKVKPPAPNQGGSFGSYAIKNFREESAYGDAQLAERDQVQRALLGHTVPDAPHFES